ncbi:ATP-dependent helicase [Deltaproteobacteria bacterium Smac51]|nr:ATP-dependent helicase [Deltaproteobacteria bacterium Smac51]
MITDYHAKYFAYDLTRKASSAENVGGRISMALYDSAVDLNPHQVEAALFALRSPLTKGVILADEVGLGKTIEAGLVLAQFWAEHKRRLLVICPASLRRQWSLELLDKFGLPSLILESANFKGIKLAELDKIAIVSVQFASRYAKQIEGVPWDLVTIDEAHKLRNLYQPGNKMGKAICESLSGRRKVLLTATPLQNSLLELFGLSALVDEHLFGSLEAFKAAYLNPKADLGDLKSRLAPVLKRTLRREVLEYIQFTHREAITQPFTLSDEEQHLYDEVSGFLLEPETYAIPMGQRSLVVLVIRKLLASSSYALIGTLKTIRGRLEDMLSSGQSKPLRLNLAESSSEYLAEELEPNRTKPLHKTVDRQKLTQELAIIDRFLTMARAIKVETKAKALLAALDIAFARLKELGAAPKALIFTESSRTQRYLKEFLTANGYQGRLVTFNGQNDDPESKALYRQWMTDHTTAPRRTGSLNVDLRQAIVDRFKNQADIMVATEAGAEGLNLQFCSLVINYDLPWNPQRIEQRIGRVHRYGQKHDVVVVNFLNEKNHADQRLYEILKEKFKLFDGVFGASDEILGRLESGLDFEKRILGIFDTCRTPEEIETAFGALQAELEKPIEDRLAQSRRLLLESFDEEVHQRLLSGLDETGRKLDDIGHKFWALTKYYYGNEKEPGGRLRYYFNDKEMIFGHDEAFIKNGRREADSLRTPLYYYVDTGPAPAVDLEATPAQTRKKAREGTKGGGRPHRLSGLEGELITLRAKKLALEPVRLVFDLSGHEGHIGLLESLGKSGWLFLDLLSLETFELMEHLIFNLYGEDGTPLNPEAGPLLFQLNAEVSGDYIPFPWPECLQADLEERVSALAIKAEENNQRYFVEELDKIDRWSDDLKNGLELEIEALNREIRDVDRQSRLQKALADKLVFQKQKAALEKKRHQKRHELFTAQDEVDRKRRLIIEQIEKQMESGQSQIERLMTVHWVIR